MLPGSPRWGPGRACCGSTATRSPCRPTSGSAPGIGPDAGVEQLGWPGVEIAYTPGPRLPERASLRVTERGGKPLDIEVESLGYVALHVGAGYGGDPDWTHGQWRGRD